MAVAGLLEDGFSAVERQIIEAAQKGDHAEFPPPAEGGASPPATTDAQPSSSQP